MARRKRTQLNHKGRPRRLYTSKQQKVKNVAFDRKTAIKIHRNPILKKKLVQLVQQCPHRKNTGKISSAPCCASEGGKVFHCTLYDLIPAKLYDCLVCRRDDAVSKGEPWIKPLLSLSQGSDVPRSLLVHLS